MLVGTLLLLVSLLIFHESRKGGKSLSPQQLTHAINKEDAVVLDVRDGAEFKAGHIPGAINIPFSGFDKRMTELDKYKQRPVVLVCKMGQHSGAISKKLKGAGFESVFKLSGGIAEWQNSQFPLVK